MCTRRPSSLRSRSDAAFSSLGTKPVYDTAPTASDLRSKRGTKPAAYIPSMVPTSQSTHTKELRAYRVQENKGKVGSAMS